MAGLVDIRPLKHYEYAEELQVEAWMGVLYGEYIRWGLCRYFMGIMDYLGFRVYEISELPVRNLN